MHQLFAHLPSGQWLQIPETFRDLYEQAGAKLHPVPEGTPPVEVPTPVQASAPPSVGEGSDLGKGAGSESSPAVLNDDAEVQREVARETARRSTMAPPPHHEAFIAPRFSVGPGKAQRCKGCGELYSPRTQDHGRCSTCQRAANFQRRATA